MALASARQPAETMDYVNSTTASIPDGTVVLVESTLGVVVGGAIAASKTGALDITNSFSIPKDATTNAVSQGVKVYWDAGTPGITTTASTHKPAGLAMAASSTAQANVDVKLNAGSGAA